MFVPTDSPLVVAPMMHLPLLFAPARGDRQPQRATGMAANPLASRRPLEVRAAIAPDIVMLCYVMLSIKRKA